MFFYVLRHGMTGANKNGSHGDNESDVDLCPEGADLVRKIAPKLPHDISLIVSGTKNRHLQTTGIILEQPDFQEVQVEYTEKLNERRFGTLLDGKRIEDLPPGMRERDWALDYDYGQWGGESAQQVFNRVWEVVGGLRPRFQSTKGFPLKGFPLLVTSAGVIRWFLRYSNRDTNRTIDNCAFFNFDL